MESPASTPKIARAVVAAFAAALFAKSFLVDFMVAEGPSMLPTIPSGNVLLVNKAAYGIVLPFSSRYLLRWSAPRPGDIVVFPSPDGRLAVKRSAESGSEGYFLAFGDNAAESYDSRAYGPVANDRVLGRVVGIR